MQTQQSDRKYLLDYSREDLIDFVEEINLESYRADQIFKGLYVQQISDFIDLTTLSKSTREKLSQKAVIRALQQMDITISPSDNTTKFLWRLADGFKIESVIIYESKRVTFCISSQVGCALDCQFCSTGKMGFLRNLSSGEIVEQVLQMKQQSLKPVTNIVFMGMGEPLLNIRNVLKAAHMLSEPEGLAFSRKKITISTSGVVPGIRQLAELNAPFSLAVSLNAVYEQKRKNIMPISANYPLPDLMNAVRDYTKQTGKRVTFEYILIKDFNDTKEDADQLIDLTIKIPCKINLIPCNSADPAYPPTSIERAKWFADYLHDRGRTATLRSRKGWEIQAACGQLYSKNEARTGTKITMSGKIKQLKTN